MKMLVMNKVLILSGVALLSFPYAYAANRYWSANENALWNDAANWDGTIPSSSDYIYIVNGGTAVISSGVTGLGNYGYFGYDTGTSGNLIIENGGTYDGGSYAYFGYNADSIGSLTIEDGGAYESNQAILAQNAGSRGTVTMNGSATFATSGTFSIGRGGDAIMTLNGTSSITSGTIGTTKVHIGENAGSTGTLYLNDSAIWTAASGVTLVVGNNGTGNLFASGTSSISVGADMFIGNTTGSSGTVILKDNATLEVTTVGRMLNIGYSASGAGTGSLMLQDEAEATVIATNIGMNGTGSLTVAGESTFNSGTIFMQEAKSSIMVAGSGTINTTGATTIYYVNPSTGAAVTVKGSGQWISGGAISIDSGSTFNVLDEGLVSNTARTTVSNTSSVTVSGDAARWTNSDDIYVTAGSSFNVAGNGSVSSTKGIYVSNSTFDITDTGSVTSAESWIYGGGTMSISDNASLTSSDVVVGYGSGSSTLVLNDSATLKTSQVILGYNSAGTIEINSDGVKILNTDGLTPAQIIGNTGPGSIKFQQTGSLNFANIISGANVRVEHSGLGTTIIEAANTYGAGTSITGGTIVAANSNALGSGSVSVAGGTLKISSASLDVGSLSLESGSIDMNDGIIEILNVGNFTMTGGILKLDVLSLDSFDQLLSVSGTMMFSDGVILLNGYEAFEGNPISRIGSKYKIFDGFDSINSDSLVIKGYDETSWQARVESDGYLYFNAIPEPSAYAAIFGMLALAFTGCRRR